jgi:hypothetical protein
VGVGFAWFFGLRGLWGFLGGLRQLSIWSQSGVSLELVWRLLWVSGSRLLVDSLTCDIAQ